MDARKKKQIKARLRAAAFVTETYREQQKTPASTCSRSFGWIKFGYIAFVVMLCLGVTLIILGGVKNKTDLLILGGVFILGSFIFLSVVCAPGEKCGRNNRVVSGTATEVTQEAVEIESESIKHHRRIEHTGKKLSFLSGMKLAMAKETSNRRTSLEVTKVDRSWVKMVETSKQTMQRKKESAIEEEPNSSAGLQGNKETDLNIESGSTNEKSLEMTPRTDLQSHSNEFEPKVEEGRLAINEYLNAHGDTNEPPPTKKHKRKRHKQINGDSHDMLGKYNSSQIIDVDPVIHATDKTNADNHSFNVINETNLDSAKEEIVADMNRTDVEVHSEKKKKRKKKKKKRHRDVVTEIGFDNGAFNESENLEKQTYLTEM